MLMNGLGKYGEGVSNRDSFIWASVATVNNFRYTQLDHASDYTRHMFIHKRK